MIKLDPIAQETITYICGLDLNNSVINYLNKRTEGMYPEDRVKFESTFNDIANCITGYNQSNIFYHMSIRGFCSTFGALKFVDAEHRSVHIEDTIPSQGILVELELKMRCYRPDTRHFYIPLEIIRDLYKELKALYPEGTKIYWGDDMP